MNTEARVTEDVATAVASDLELTRRNVTALGTAIRAAHLTAASPALTRAVSAQQNLYERIDAEFGLLTSAQAADRMSSRAVARRNAATAARSEGRLLALRRGKYLLYPSSFGRLFQSGPGLDWLIEACSPLRVDVLPPGPM